MCRLVNDAEIELVANLGDECRYPSGPADCKPCDFTEIKKTESNYTN